MSASLLEYWRLRERPFEATWDARFFFLSRDHDEALNRLLFLVGEQTMNMGMLTGQIGCGKTITRAAFAERLDPREFCVVTQENSNFGFKDLLIYMVNSLNGATAGSRMTKFALYERLRALVQKLQAEQRHLVLLFDEAQEMSLPTLNELKLLTNFNGAGQAVLTIILLGQPELRHKVAQLPAIDQRISLRFHLGPMTREEVAGYLEHRLRQAGREQGDLFTEEAVNRAHAVSRGIPRELNRLAKLALEYAWLQEMSRVTVDAVDTVALDLERQQQVGSS
ncbi:AAA family ATPase [bacterium]|nr:AAA family ATPase [bacterium]